jgi:hypothetical protein
MNFYTSSTKHFQVGVCKSQKLLISFATFICPSKYNDLAPNELICICYFVKIHIKNQIWLKLGKNIGHFR